MTRKLPFGDVLEAALQLTEDEQGELIAILKRRLSKAARQRLAAEINDARQEFAEGRCSPSSADKLMREIMPVVESFRKGWEETQGGETMPIDRLWEGIDVE